MVGVSDTELFSQNVSVQFLNFKFSTTPCSSSLLNIHKVFNLGHLQSWKLIEIKEKLMNLPLPNSSTAIILPLLHLQ